MASGRLSVTFQCVLVSTFLLLVTLTLASDGDPPATQPDSKTSPPENGKSPAVLSSRVGEIARIRIVYGPKGTHGKNVEKSPRRSPIKIGKESNPKLLSSANGKRKYATLEPVAAGAVSRVRIYSGKVPPSGVAPPRHAPRPRPPGPRPKIIIRPGGSPRPQPPPPKLVRVPVPISGPSASPHHEHPPAHAFPSHPPPPPPSTYSEPTQNPHPHSVAVPVPFPHPHPQPFVEREPEKSLEVFVVSEEQVRAGPVFINNGGVSNAPPPTVFSNYPAAGTRTRPSSAFDEYSNGHQYPHEHEHSLQSSQSFKYDRPGSQVDERPPGYRPQQQMPGELTDSFGLSSYDRRPPAPAERPEYDYTQGRDQIARMPPRIPAAVRSHDGTFMNMHGPIPGRNENGLVHPTYTKNYWLSGLNPPQVVLEDLKIIPETVTMSGFSSGGGLAQQLLVSYPSLFRGIAVFQQTYYRCGRGNGDIQEFDTQCTNLGNHTQAYDPNIAINDINAYFHNGLIEDPRGLRDKLLYVYAGLQNNVYRPEQMLSTLRVFEPFIGNRFRIRTRVQDAANLLPTDTFGGPCDVPANENHFLGNCNLNGPFEALGFLLGEDTIKLPDESVQPDMNSLLEFDQSEFFEGLPRTGPHFMARTGYMYVPDRCGPNGNTKCQFHIYFHGCRTGRDFNDGNHIRHSGWLQLAELNDVIIMFPQIQRHERNPLGCWDTYGNTGPLYATQKGLQVSIIRKMLARVLGTDGAGAGSDANEVEPPAGPVPVALSSGGSRYHHVS